MKKTFGIFLWTFILVVSMFTSPMSVAESTTLKDHISCMDALTMMVAAAQTQGEQLEESSVSADGGNLSADVTHFHLTASAGSNGFAERVTISADYLDADLAKSMGIIHGMLCVHLGGMTEDDTQTILSSIDFSAFDKLKSNTQTLIHKGYKIIASIVPDDRYCYQLSLALQTSNQTETKIENKNAEASVILHALNVPTSAAFLFDENTDRNGLLGQPNQYYSKVNFALASIDPNAIQNADLSVEQGGSIEVFETGIDAINRQHKVSTNLLTYFGTAEYNFIYENVLLRLSLKTPLDELETIISRFIETVSNKESLTSLNSQERFVSVKVGEVVRFGTYEQDGNKSNGSEPIEWIVIKAEGNTAMLISVNALDVYNTYWGSATWDHSTLRTWMNEEFYESAFSASEKEAIIKDKVAAEKNLNFETDPGDDTIDRVFALSYNEANTLLTTAQRCCKPTVYAVKDKSVYADNAGNCYWWLRSPGKQGCGASIVCTDGSFDYDVSYDGFCYGMRPAIRVDLSVVSFK